MDKIVCNDFNDMIPITRLRNHLLLLMMRINKDNHNALCNPANLETRCLYAAVSILNYMKSSFYQQVDWRYSDIRFMYHDIINRRFQTGVISEMIKEFVRNMKDLVNFDNPDPFYIYLMEKAAPKKIKQIKK